MRTTWSKYHPGNTWLIFQQLELGGTNHPPVIKPGNGTSIISQQIQGGPPQTVKLICDFNNYGLC